MSMLEPDPDALEEPIWSDAPGSPAFEARAARLGQAMRADVRRLAAQAAAASPVYVLRHLVTGALYQRTQGDGSFPRTAQALAWSTPRGAAEYLANPNHRLPEGTPVCEWYAAGTLPLGQFLAQLGITDGGPATYLLDGRPHTHAPRPRAEKEAHRGNGH